MTTDESTLEQRRQDRREDSRAVGVYLLGRTVAMVLVLAGQIVAAAVYAPLGLAYVVAVLLLVETSIALGSLGLPDVVFYFLGRDPDRSAAIVRQTSMILLGTAAVVAPLVVGAAVVISQSGEIDLIPALPWLALIVVVELPTQPAVNQLIAHGRAGTAAILFAWFALTRTIAVIVPAATGCAMTWVPITMAILGLTRVIAHLWIVRRIYPLAPGQRWWLRHQMREIFTFALPSGVSATVGRLNPQIDKYAVELMLGAHALALYGIAAFELPLVTMVPYAIGAVMQIRYVRLYAAGDRAELRAVWYATVEKTMLLVIPLAIVIIVMAHDLIVLAFSSQYVIATAPFQIFTVILLHRVAAYGPMLQATGQQRLQVISSLLMVITNLGLQYPMTRLFGINGPALATALANVPAWLFTLSRIGRALGGGLAIALPWRFYARTLAIGAAVGVALHLARPALRFHPGVNLAIGVSGYAIVFVVVARLGGVLKPEDTAYVRRALGLGASR